MLSSASISGPVQGVSINNVVLGVCILCSGAFAVWHDDFNRTAVGSMWDVVGKNGGRVAIQADSGPDDSPAFTLDMPASKAKQAFAVCLADVPQPGGGPVTIAFDMSMRPGPYG